MQQRQGVGYDFFYPKDNKLYFNLHGISSCDVIATGTPGGVGSRRDPKVWMWPGDICEIDISQVGVLSNPIIEG